MSDSNQNTLTTVPAPKRETPSALVTMAGRFDVEPSKLLSTLKETVFKNANEAQLMALCIVANQFDLNPFLKQIYAFPDKGGGIVPVVSVDGWIKIMNDHPQFDGITFEFIDDEGGKPYACAASIHRKDRTRPSIVTEYLSECYRNTDPWRTAPRRMLRHKALIQCTRVAFGFAGIHDEDDADDILKDPAPLPRAILGTVQNVVTKTDPAPEVLKPLKTARPKAKAEPAPEPAQEAPPPTNFDPTQGGTDGKEPEPEPEPSEEEPADTLGKIRFRLKAAGYTEEEFIKAAIAWKLCEPSVKSIDKITEEKRKLALDDWDSALEDLAGLREQAAQKGGK